LKWPGFRDPELMGIADLHAPEFKHSELLSIATELLHSHLTSRLQAERGNIVREWISEGVYPFENNDGDPSLNVERELFDIVAVIASPSVPKRGTDQKRLTLRLLKEALRAEPDRLRTALDAVIPGRRRPRQSRASTQAHRAQCDRAGVIEGRRPARLSGWTRLAPLRR